MYPLFQLTGEGGLKMLEKYLLGGDQKFSFWWGGGLYCCGGSNSAEGREVTELGRKI